MKKITFQFVANDCVEGALIRWKTNSEIEHVNLVTEDGHLQGALMVGGIQKRQVNYSEFTLQILVTLEVTEEQYVKFWAYANAKLGEHYNMAGILGVALGDNITDPRQAFCSQYACDCINAAGLFRIDKATCKIDPEMLRMMLMTQPSASETRIEAIKSQQEFQFLS